MDIKKSKIRDVLMITALALMLAVIFDYLFFGKVIGLSVMVFAAIIVGLLWWLSARTVWLAAPILFFALMPAIRANFFLNALNILAIAGLLLLTFRELLQEHIARFKILDYFKTIFQVPLRIAASSIRPLRFGLTQFRQSSNAAWRRILIGIVMALPVLIIFTILFSSADLAFKQAVTSVFNFQISEEFFQHALLLLVIFALSLGSLEYLFKATGATTAVTEVKPTEETSGREVETQVFLYLIAALFALFIIFQISYLFGGDVNITNRGFTYAEYARRGFWELLAVAFATLVILLFADSYTSRETSRKKWFTIPSSLIILEILLIITSAFKRLVLYQDAYGLTLLRFYVAAFIIFLGVIFVLLGIKFIYEKKENFFAFASLFAIIAFLAGINLVNPDMFVAGRNISKFNETGKIDTKYLGSLSADALPQILKVLPRLSQEDKAVVQNGLDARREELEAFGKHWQSYNYSRSKALERLGK